MIRIKLIKSFLFNIKSFLLFRNVYISTKKKKKIIALYFLEKMNLRIKFQEKKKKSIFINENR